MVDEVIKNKTRTGRKFCSFYTESDPILTYMVSRLGISADNKILEPCAGDGVFIEKILTDYGNTPLEIDAYDLNPEATDRLVSKFSKNKSIKVKNADTLLDNDLDLLSNMGGYYDKVIGNPPYGAWQEYDKRNELKRKYGGYVRETYTLFIRRCVNLLKNDGRLVFIIPDTFLALHLHKDLRHFLLLNTKIEEILLIPSKFFPGVSFGYSNLCIISLVKKKPNQTDYFNLVKVAKDINTLYELANKNYSSADKNVKILQLGVVKNLAHSFYINGSEKINKLVNTHNVSLGDLANCVTGFYSGDNKRFIKTLQGNDRSDFEIISSSDIEYEPWNVHDALDGLTKKKYIPIYKGGKAVIDKNLENFVDWQKDTVAFYKSDKKARFQNASYYFKKGIGVPMVKSNKLSAFRINRHIFDQSVVGVFPKNESHYNLLLTFLNSEVCSKIINSINHTANNSSNYLKKLPVIFTEQTIREASQIVEMYDATKDATVFLENVNSLFNPIYKL